VPALDAFCIGEPRAHTSNRAHEQERALPEPRGGRQVPDQAGAQHHDPQRTGRRPEDDLGDRRVEQQERRVAEERQRLERTTADPTRDGIPDPGEGTEPSAAFGDPGAGSDTAGSGRPPRARDEHGRFIGSSRPAAVATLPVSVALEHALIDADAATYLATVHAKLRMARVVLDAIRFGVEADRLETALAVKAGMLVRLGSDGGQP